MAFVFETPVAAVRPFAKRSSDPHARFWSHFTPAQAGVNVFLLNDGSVTTQEPYADEGVRRIFHGGHLHPVDEAEKILLEAAGYSVATVADPVTPTGLAGGGTVPWDSNLTPQAGVPGAGYGSDLDDGFTAPPAPDPVVTDSLPGFDDGSTDPNLAPQPGVPATGEDYFFHPTPDTGFGLAAFGTSPFGGTL